MHCATAPQISKREYEGREGGGRTVSDDGEVVVCGTVPCLLVQSVVAIPRKSHQLRTFLRKGRGEGTHHVHVLSVRPSWSGGDPASRHWLLFASRMGPALFLAGMIHSWVFLNRSLNGMQGPLKGRSQRGRRM